eukprot:XP_001612161.1 hypothetical protein [Babesia bovis T2Bo]
MALICRIDEGRIPVGHYSLARRCIGLHSEDNKVALLLFNYAYILETRRYYVEIVAGWRSGSSQPVVERQMGEYRSTLDLDVDTPEAIADEQINTDLTMPRFVSASWTPPVIQTEHGLGSALCTVDLKNQIELWMPKKSRGDGVYDIEKICDLTAAVMSGISFDNDHDVPGDIHTNAGVIPSGPGEDMRHPGLSICHFDQSPEILNFGGFLGLIASGQRVLAIWLTSNEDGGSVDTDPLAINNGDECTNAGGKSNDRSLEGPPSKFIQIASKYYPINQLPESLWKFDIDCMKDLYPISTVKTVNPRISDHIVAYIDSGNVNSISSRLLRSTESQLLYDIFVATADGHIKVAQLELSFDMKGTVRGSIGPWRDILRVERPAEMLRVRVFPCVNGDISLLIMLVHNSVVFVNLDNGGCQMHRCGSHPLVAYHTSPLYMRGGDIVQVELVDVIGTRFTVIMDTDLQLRQVDSVTMHSSDLTTVFLDDTKVARIEVLINRVTTEVRRSLRSPNIFSIAISILESKGSLEHFIKLIEHSVCRNEMVYTNTMFLRETNAIEASMSTLSMEQFVHLASTNADMSFWRDIHTAVGDNRMATLLYLVAYAEAGGDTDQGITPIELRAECKPLVTRMLSNLHPEKEITEQLEHLVTVLYSKKPVAMLKHEL